MTAPPPQPKIYHITHVDNLPDILSDGGLLSDRRMIDRGGPTQAIGMSEIKRRRVEELEVACHPGTNVGDYVPFYFCPRSVMLYVIRMANHPELSYRGGQKPIVHLEADLHTVVSLADEGDEPWAFSLSNAGAYYTEFRSDVAQLDQLDWGAIAATDFSSSEVKECKQAEFLVHDWFPFELVERVGVQTREVSRQVASAIGSGQSCVVEVRPDWYF